MKRSRISIVLVVAAVWSACSDGTDIEVPASLEIISGAGQVAARGHALRTPVVVRVLDEAGDPISSVTVSFTPSNGGMADPAAAQSDADGMVETRWTLGGAIAGFQTLTIDTRAELQETVMAEALSPCDPSGWFDLTDDAPVTGEVDELGCDLGLGGSSDVYRLESDRMSAVELRQTGGAELDPFLTLRSLEAPELLLAENDDDPDVPFALDAHLRVLLPAGTHAVAAGSFDDTRGPYSLSVSSVPSEVDDCLTWWVLPGVVTSQNLESTDCEEGGVILDRMTVYLNAGETLRVDMTSTIFDSFIELRNANGFLVASDDDSGEGFNARLSYTAASGGPRVIGASSFSTGRTGPYEISVSVDGR